MKNRAIIFVLLFFFCLLNKSYAAVNTANVGGWFIRTYKPSDEPFDYQRVKFRVLQNGFNDYMAIPIEMTNISKIPLYPPCIRLEDDNGNEFDLVEPSIVRVYLDGKDTTRFGKYPPSITIEKLLVFDVPSDRSYSLKIYDGNPLFSKKYEYIHLYQAGEIK